MFKKKKCFNEHNFELSGHDIRKAMLWLPTVPFQLNKNLQHHFTPALLNLKLKIYLKKNWLIYNNCTKNTLLWQDNYFLEDYLMITFNNQIMKLLDS